ncbi:hypothetical protein B0H14DRAFT_3128034 [Mycena olivaceomarginata]|nr:hypothetical protein B0H14DRAFT_3128034 [Mycena olivaceomarginata]
MLASATAPDHMSCTRSRERISSGNRPYTEPVHRDVDAFPMIFASNLLTAASHPPLVPTPFCGSSFHTGVQQGSFAPDTCHGGEVCCTSPSRWLALYSMVICANSRGLKKRYVCCCSFLFAEPDVSQMYICTASACARSSRAAWTLHDKLLCCVPVSLSAVIQLQSPTLIQPFKVHKLSSPSATHRIFKCLMVYSHLPRWNFDVAFIPFNYLSKGLTIQGSWLARRTTTESTCLASVVSDVERRLLRLASRTQTISASLMGRTIVLNYCRYFLHVRQCPHNDRLLSRTYLDPCRGPEGPIFNLCSQNVDIRCL